MMMMTTFRQLPPRSFVGLTRLKTLSVHTFNADWTSMSLEPDYESLIGLNLLEDLDLSNNNLASMPAGLLCPLVNIVSVRMTIFRFFKKAPLHPVWPDFSKFHHFGKIVKVLSIILKVNFVLGNIFNLPCKNISYHWTNVHFSTLSPMLPDSHPSQQHTGLLHAVWQPQQVVTRPKARFQPTSPKKSGVDLSFKIKLRIIAEFYQV